MFVVQGALRNLRRLVRVTAAVGAAAAALLVSSASAAEITQVVKGQPNLVDVIHDASGNLYLSDNTGTVRVLAAKSGTLFGRPVKAGSFTTLAKLKNVPGIALQSGNLYMSDVTAGTISVLPSLSGTLFGKKVTADKVATLRSGLITPIGIAFRAGNLFVADASGVAILPSQTGTVFGQAVTKNKLVQLSAASGLPTGTPGPALIAFDPSGDLFVSDSADGNVYALAPASKTLFGHPVKAGKLSILFSGGPGVAVDPAGNLYAPAGGNLDVLPVATGTLYGQPVTANTLNTLGVAVGPLGMSYYGGNLYMADQGFDSVDRLSAPTAHITKVTFTGTPTNPTITITGSGFRRPAASVAAGCSATGLDYEYGDLYLNDTTTAVQMGVPGDCVGLVTSTFTPTKVVFTLGSYYNSNTADISNGDSVTVAVDGRSFTTTVSYS